MTPDDVFVNPPEAVDGDTPEGRARLLAEEPPAAVGDQLERLRGLADDPTLDPHDAADIEGALRLVEHHRRILVRDLDPAAAQRLDQLTAQATQLGAAHQRIFDRPPLAAIVERRRAGGAAAARSKADRNGQFERESLRTWTERLRELYDGGERNHRQAAALISDELQAQTGDNRHSEQRIYEATAPTWKALKQGQNT